jgi:hypothetical protein
MKEFPVFVPFGSEHIAAIVTVPDQPTDSMVLLMQGLGAPRSHRYGLWKRTAHKLADGGIASVRFDYPQLGDSTGVVAVEMDKPPVEEGRAVLRFVRGALGVDKIGLIGNCSGLVAGFELVASEPGFASVACFLPDPPKEILVDNRTRQSHLAARRMSRNFPRIRRTASRFVHVKKGSFGRGLTPAVARTMRTTDMMFLLAGSEKTGGQLTQSVAALKKEIGLGPQRRAEVVTIVADGTDEFQLPRFTHPKVVDALVSWMNETLGGRAPASDFDSHNGISA